MPMEHEAKQRARGVLRTIPVMGGSGKRQLADGSYVCLPPSASSEDSACRCHPASTKLVWAEYYGMAALALILLAGCGIGGERMSPLEMKARDLEREKAQLARQLEQSRVEAEQLKAQIQTLAALPQSQPENLFYALSAVKINRFTDFYDKNEDGKRDKLIVYLQPVDRAGDAIKTAGIVSVQLWDLNRPDGQALLGRWQVLPAELYKLWFSTLTSTAFRLTFDVATTPEMLAQPLTVRSTFTDYLTGQVFTDQYVIQPRTDTSKQ